MNIEIRNKRIGLRYKSGNYSMKSIATKYNLSPQRIKDILEFEIGQDGINKVKAMRKEHIAERLKENYLKGLWQK